MTDKVDRCKFFAMTGIRASAGEYGGHECKVCPLRNEQGDCINDIMDDHCQQMSEQIGQIWRDYFERKGNERRNGKNRNV